MSEIRLIDANALIAEVNKKKVVGRFNVVELIDNFPTIKLYGGSPIGNWEIASSGTANYFICSNCNRPGDIWDNYCRFCGCYMENNCNPNKESN